MKTNKPPLILDELIPILVGVWRKFQKLSGPSDRLQTREFRTAVESLKTLKQGLENTKELLGKDYFTDRETLSSYLLYPFLLHYQEAMSVIGEIPNSIRRVLDIGSGPGPFALAALKHGASDVTATDQNLTALELAAEIAGKNGYPLSIRKWNCKTNIPVDGHFDLITVGHVLEELFPANSKSWQEQQNNFIRYLLSKLTPEGHLILVDSSFGESNRRILQIREDFVKDGVPVQAPCVWRGTCPALATPNSPCYAQRPLEKPFIISEFQRALEINLSSLKMSYLILKKPGSQWPELPSYPVSRVISPPVESHLGNKYYLCGTDGKKSLTSHLKDHPKQSRAFEFLKRGELISLHNALEKGSQLEIIQETTLTVEAPIGKPI